MLLDRFAVLLLAASVLAAPAGWAQTPLVANRPLLPEVLPDLARDLLSGELCRSGAEPDTVQPWRYLPLAVGNAWEYETWFGHARIDIPKDTLVDDRRYFVWDQQEYDGGRDRIRGYRPLVRYDSISTRIVENFGDGSGNEIPFIFSPCPLDADFGTSVECFEGDFFEVSGTYDGVLDFEPDTTVTGVAVKTFAVEFYLNRFAAGFGKTLFQEFKAGGSYALRYARVGGEEFGEALFPVAAEPNGPEPAATVSLEVWPNPFDTAFSVALALSEPGAVTVEVVDVLGRVVRRLDVGWLSPGEQTLRLSGGGLASGLYVVRVRTEEGTSATRKALKR